MPITPVSSDPLEMLWLSDVRENAQPLDELTPIWVRPGEVTEGLAIPFPERHPYCEFGINFTGEGVQYVGGEKAIRRAGDVFMAGPGLPHWHEIVRYPTRFITVYFLPSVLIETGGRDGLALLRRFSVGRSIADRLVRPPAALRRRLDSRIEEVAAEFAGHQLGRQLRMRTLLADMVLDLVRWERERDNVDGQTSNSLREQRDQANWANIESALRYLHENYARPIYASDLADAICVSQTRLKELFREGLGIPWGRYLRAYRIQRAASLLATTDRGIIDVAAAVGFESVSHFESTFREYMGRSPKDPAGLHS